MVMLSRFVALSVSLTPKVSPFQNYNYPNYNCGTPPVPGGASCDSQSLLLREVFNRSFTSLVQRQAHRPSIFGWVLSNECQFLDAGSPTGTPHHNQFAQLYMFGKSFDPERPIWYSDGANTGTKQSGIVGNSSNLWNLRCQAHNLTAEDDTSCPFCLPVIQGCCPSYKGPDNNGCRPNCPYMRCFEDIFSWSANCPHAFICLSC